MWFEQSNVFDGGKLQMFSVSTFPSLPPPFAGRWPNYLNLGNSGSSTQDKIVLMKSWPILIKSELWCCRTHNVRWVYTSGENLFKIYRRLIGSIYRIRSAIYYTRSTCRNISDALARLTSDHKYFSMYPNINTSQWIAQKKRKRVG